MSNVAGAPISWGVCEVPGWGHQLAPERVLAEMRDVGLVATEFGPDGFLPVDPVAKAETLTSNGLRAVGGFVPVVLHDPDHDPLPEVDTALDAFVAAQAGTLVLAAVTGLDGYDRSPGNDRSPGYDARPNLDEDGWQRLLYNLDRLAARAAERGITATLHPHVGTMVERTDDVRRVLDGATIPLCLDTGHLLIGGTDPAALAREVPERIAHVHLKDVDEGWAQRVRSGSVGYQAAVRDGMYRPLGQGDVDIAGIVGALDRVGYRGWYVIEQDTILDAEPAAGAGPVADVRVSLAYLDGLPLTGPGQ